MKDIFVVCAIIKENGKYLITQRAANDQLGGKWEFPGGTLGKKELPEKRLKMEIYQELGRKIRVKESFGTNPCIYKGIGFVHLLAYVCEFIDLCKIKKKVNYVWVTPKEMVDYDFCEADKAFVKKLQEEKRLPN